jgi:hypothetical protein
VEINETTVQFLLNAAFAGINAWEAAAVVGVDLGLPRVEPRESRYNVRQVDESQLVGFPHGVHDEVVRMPAGWVIYSRYGDAVLDPAVVAVKDLVGHSAFLRPPSDICVE